VGSKYSSQSISGYNATPPSDDGTVAESNKTKWSHVTGKIGGPLKTLAEAINTALTSHFDRGPTAYTSSQSIGASLFNEIIQVSGSGVTLTLADAATLGAGWFCDILNTDSSNTVTLARATGGDTINGTASNVSLTPLSSVRAFVVADGSGFFLFYHGQNYVNQQYFYTATLTDATNISWNLDIAQVAQVTLADNRTLDNPTNMRNGGHYTLRVIQDGTGSRTLAYGNAYLFPYGVAPILSTAGSSIDVLTFISDGTNMYGTVQYNFS